MRLKDRLRLYLVTDPRAGTPDELLRRSREALEGGATTVQLRVKGWTDRDALSAAEGLRELCDEFDALYLVNDRVDLALASNADGVHLGVDDLPVAAARRILGAEAVIGFSPETDLDIEAAISGGASYLGVGPVYGTQTKADAGPAIGLDRIAEVVAASSVPLIGIGGINQGNARAVIDAGACGVAVVSSVFMAEDPAKAAGELWQALA